MSSSIASSRAGIRLDSSISHHEPLIGHKDRKRCRSRSPEYGGGDDNNRTGFIPSKSATIRTLKRQILCLQQLLQDAPAQPHITPTGHTCPSASCRKRFKKLEHLYRHVRSQNDTTHKSLAVFIDETHCLICFKTFRRPTDLVKHEKQRHGETFTSRLDRFLQSPPSSHPVAIDDAPESSDVHDEDSCGTSGFNHQSNSHRASRPRSSQTNASVGVEGTQIQDPKIVSSADEATVSKRSENGRGELQSMGPGVVENDRWVATKPTPPTFETESALLAPQSWDYFYVNTNGWWQESGNERWDYFYVNTNGWRQESGNERWDGSYENCRWVLYAGSVSNTYIAANM